MDSIERSVFLSYRRANAPWALAVYQHLTQHGFDVFLDYTGIASGDFESVILENIASRAHFIVVLTPSALTRSDQPGDWLRREIEVAIERRRNIVPLLIEGFTFSAPAVSALLTGTLVHLKAYNGLRVTVDYFDAAMDRLRIKFLNVALDAVLHPRSVAATIAAAEQQTEATRAPAVQARQLAAQKMFEKATIATSPVEALRCYDEAVHLDPNSAAALNNRGATRVIQGDLEGGINDLSEAIRLDPMLAVAYYNRGSAYVRKDENIEGLRDLDFSLHLNPGSAQAHYYRGLARRDLNDHDGAVQDLGEAIRVDPALLMAYYERGLLRRSKGDSEGAFSDLSHVIRLKPDFPGPYVHRAIWYLEEKKLEEGIRDATEATRFGHAGAYNVRGLLKRQKADLKGASGDFSEALRLNPRFAEACLNRGMTHFDQGDLRQAIQDYTRAIKLKPRFQLAYYQRACAESEAENWIGAIRDFTQAIAIVPDSLDSYIGRAKARMKHGDLAGAKQDIETATRLKERSR